MREKIFFILLIISTFQISAQNITGVVTDGGSGDKLIGVTVSIKGENKGTVTNIDGEYGIATSPDDTLIFSFLGYISEEIAVGTQETIDISMVPNLISLQDVVVVGYGSMKKEHITGSVALVDDEVMEDRPNTNVGSLIQGRAAGVKVLTNSGKPSEGFNLRIRGTNSIGASSEPLYVIDGVPTNDTRSINPSDIESISILKDASSAAIYGSQGANGVVLITTKKGVTEKPRISLDTYIGASSVWKTQKVLNSEQYRDLMTEMGLNTNWSLYNENTDWQNKIFQTGWSKNCQLSISGKSKTTNYFVSGGYTDQQGVVRSSEMKRANFKINLDQEVGKWLKIGSRISYTNYNDVDVNDNSGVDRGGVLTGALFTPPVIGEKNPDGTYTSNPFQNWENPLASTDAAIRGYKKHRLLGNIYAEFEIMEGLKFKTNYGVDQQQGMYDYFLDPYTTSYGQALQGVSQNNTDNLSYQIWDNTLRFNKEMGVHKFGVLAGTVIQKYLWENSAIETQGFASDAIITPNAGSTKTVATAYKSEKTNASFISRVNYDYDNKYLFTANFRADGSSNFGPDKRWGFFPSLSAGWRLSREAFLSNLAKLSDLKIRFGWGVNGNDQNGNYAHYGKVASGANYAIGGIAQPGTYPSSIANPLLQWEESTQSNIGLDLSLFDYRLQFVADAYIKSTNNLLLNTPLPTSTGYNSAILNIGELENRGLEFSLTSDNLKTPDLTWETSFNISFNRNEVKHIISDLYDGNIASRGEASLVTEGQPLGILYGYVWGGVDPQTGDAYYIDNEGNSTFSPDADDRKIIGDANPDFFYGLGNTVAYKGVSLNIYLEGTYGNDMLNATRIDGEAMSTPANQMQEVANRWREPGDVTDIPRATFGVTDNSRISTRFIEDASYMRIKTITISYSLPKNWIQKASIENLRLYVTGENLLTLTKYSGFDPDINSFGASNTARGIDYGTYPQTRNVIIGLNVTF